MKRVRIASFVTGLIVSTAAFLIAGSSSALTIDCSTAGCIGGTYTLDLVETTPDFWTATYTIDTTGVFSVSATDLVEINIKVANNYTNPLVTSGPMGELKFGPLSGQGCKGNNGGFLCVRLDSSQSVGGVYTWTVTFGSNTVLDEDEWHVGARYTSPTKDNGWVISETAGPGAAAPEPTAALLFGAGILLVGSVQSSIARAQRDGRDGRDRHHPPRH